MSSTLTEHEKHALIGALMQGVNVLDAVDTILVARGYEAEESDPEQPELPFDSQEALQQLSEDAAEIGEDVD